MEFFGWVLILTGVAIFLGIIKGSFAKRQKKGERDEDKLRIGFEKLCVLWSESQKLKVKFEDLARIWKEEEERIKERVREEEEVVNFQQGEVFEFYVNYLRGRSWFKGKVKEVIIELLKLIDEKGDVPSVVRLKGEEGVYDGDTYKLLSRVSLVRHLINTAEIGLNLEEARGEEEKVVIACLAHDIGKIPGFYKLLYSLGDHPLISAAVLRDVKGFSELPFAEEVLDAVRLHHRAGKGKLCQILKKADRIAREKELSEVRREIEETVKKEALEKGDGSEEGKEEKKEETYVVEDTSEEFKNKAEKRKFERREGEESLRDVELIECDVSWINVEKLKRYLLECVNVVRNGRWLAVSMPNGVIYVLPDALWKMVRHLAAEEGRADVMGYEGDEDFKRSLLISVVELLRKEGMIEEGLIKKGYFAAPFYVYIDGEDEPKRVLYVPFRAEGLGVMPSQLEARKGELLRKIRKIVPVYARNQDQLPGDNFY